MEGRIHGVKFIDLGFDQRDFVARLCFDRIACSLLIHTQPQQVFYFLEREPEILGTLDEANAFRSVVGVLPVARPSTEGLGDQTPPLVVTNGLVVYMGALRKLADGHGHMW